MTFVYSLTDSARLASSTSVQWNVTPAAVSARALGTRASWQLATGNWQLATGNWQLATGNWQLATGNWQLATDN